MIIKYSLSNLKRSMIYLFLIMLIPKLTFGEVELASDFKVFANGDVVDVPGVSESVYLDSGDSVYVYAKGTAISSTTGNLMQGMKVVCSNEYIWSTRNHEGKDAYATNSGRLTVPIQFLYGIERRDLYM